MSAEILFFCAITVFALLIIGLGISNWIYLSSISTKILSLENEVEEKTLEFEAIKKNSLASSIKNETSLQQMADESSYSDQHPQIEIVRNVRGSGFDHIDVDVGKKKEVYPQPSPLAPRLQTSTFAGQSPTMHYQSHAPLSLDQNTPPQRSAGIPPDQTRSSPSDNLNLADAPIGASTGTFANPIEIVLFSNARKDTDFAAAWKKLSEQLAGAQNPNVIFNFANVIFLYDREIQYLEKFRGIILQASGNLFFVNCDPKLLPILKKHPSLARHIRT
jgi:hypothetical protein